MICVIIIIVIDSSSFVAFVCDHAATQSLRSHVIADENVALLEIGALRRLSLSLSFSAISFFDRLFDSLIVTELIKIVSRITNDTLHSLRQLPARTRYNCAQHMSSSAKHASRIGRLVICRHVRRFPKLPLKYERNRAIRLSEISSGAKEVVSF